MDLGDLRIFRAVVDEGGVARAAARLHRVPSNVTTRVRQLEASLGVPLFLRAGRALELSAEGETLLGYADRLLALADEARQAVGSGALTGTFRLGAMESTTASRLPALLVAFHRQHPELRIELVTDTNDALLRQLRERRIDAAFVAEAPASDDTARLVAFRERLVLVSAAAHPPVRGPKDVADDTLIAFPNGCAYRRVFERWLGRRHLGMLRVLEMRSYHAILACVAAGAGVALVPESVLALSPNPAVARHALPKVLAEVRTPLVWRRAEPKPAVLAMAALLRATRGRGAKPLRGQSGERIPAL